MRTIGRMHIVRPFCAFLSLTHGEGGGFCTEAARVCRRKGPFHLQKRLYCTWGTLFGVRSCRFCMPRARVSEALHASGGSAPPFPAPPHDLQVGALALHPVAKSADFVRRFRTTLASDFRPLLGDLP